MEIKSVPMNIKELKFATKVVRNATKITEWFRENGFKTFRKKDQSPVTVADLAAQIYIISELKKHFPRDQIIAEEDATFLDEPTISLINDCFGSLKIKGIDNLSKLITHTGSNHSIRQWTTDPIDGTVSYISGSFYSVGLSLLYHSKVKVSAIAVPNYDAKALAVFSALENKGAYVSYNEDHLERIHVNTNNNLYNLILVHNINDNNTWVKKFAGIIKIKQRIEMDSMSAFCKIADGSADLFLKAIDKNLSYSWDFSPGDLLVKEAEGKVTDTVGNSLEFDNFKCLCGSGGIVVSNRYLHEKIIKILKNNSIST
ncbi:MAG: putative 3'(2'),5'-bisphosphate nucleotidase [Promethearchaeota archaeon]|nr:MAG: putative 3'(2'),5'-bisphosphate nucleotidase [Candidatus Lokiarchaeota archaeon]